METKEVGITTILGVFLRHGRKNTPLSNKFVGYLGAKQIFMSS